MREGLQLLLGRVAAVLVALANPARRYRDVPCLAYTHFQPAQLTTVGKRITLWMQELLLDAEEVLHRLETLQFRGVKGTTGTQASFLELFDGDDDKVRELDTRVSRRMGFTRVFLITGQTYTRKLDAQVLAALAGIAQSAAKFATDLRLLQHEGEMLEPFESDQGGSSAMADKRNPMRAERMTGLARFVIELEGNACHTAAGPGLRRTADRPARAAGPRSGVQGPEDRRPSRGARSRGVYRTRPAPGGRIPRARPSRRAPPRRGRGAGRGRRRGHRMTLPLVASALPLPLLRRGKVREVYEADAEPLRPL